MNGKPTSTGEFRNLAQTDESNNATLDHSEILPEELVIASEHHEFNYLLSALIPLIEKGIITENDPKIQHSALQALQELQLQAEYTSQEQAKHATIVNKQYQELNNLREAHRIQTAEITELRDRLAIQQEIITNIPSGGAEMVKNTFLDSYVPKPVDEKVRFLENKIKYDPLTKLLVGETQVLETLELIIKKIESEKRGTVAVVSIDLRGMALNNTLYSMKDTDAGIVEFANYVNSKMRSMDSFFRLHKTGDEFVLVIDLTELDASNERDLKEKADTIVYDLVHRLREGVKEHFRITPINGKLLRFNFYDGIAVKGTSLEDAREMFEKSDERLVAAKKAYKVYSAKEQGVEVDGLDPRRLDPFKDDYLDGIVF
jgi:GGDEF domain-containing protein